ncbi:MAG: outer membrane protein assembly factor BamA [Spirochaetaceae bacterium]|jgi:outer membrane protein insertion porin family|nr:outer membrane protein assembly factor BamA [Spirochaetaceae bacterium]
MRISSIVCLLLVVVVLSSPLSAQTNNNWSNGKTISKIVFTGLKNVKASELDGIISLYIGAAYSNAVGEEIVQRLFALGYFSDISAPSIEAASFDGTEITIRFTIVEYPAVSQIVFVGNSHVTRSDLMDVILLKTDDIVNDMKLRIDEQAIRMKYLEKGFPDVQVRAEKKTGAKSGDVVSFYITEGEKIVIGAIQFEGITVFPVNTIKRLLSLKAKGLFNDGAFQEAKLLTDQRAILQYYRDRGYIDVEVLDVQRDTGKDEKGNTVMTLTFKIVEGKQYIFNGIAFEGNQIFSTKQLSDLIRSKPGEIVNAQKLAEDFQRVTDLYLENGYINNNIMQEEIRDTEQGTIAFKISIIEHGRAHIENIIVKGNKKTKTDVILRELPLEVGDIFSRTRVMNGLRNLYNLQYFSEILPDIQQGSADGLTDLVFTVEEQPTINLQFGLTFSGISDTGTLPISGLLEVNDRNFLGRGNIFGGKVNVASETQSLSVEYTHRWIFGIPLSVSFDFNAQHTNRQAALDILAPYFNGDEEYAYPDGFSSYEEYYLSGKNPPDAYLMKYNQWYLSFGTSTGYRFSTRLGNLGIGGGIRVGAILNEFDDALFRPFDPALRNSRGRWTPANSLWTTVYLDQRDISYDPSSGYYGIQRFGLYGILNEEPEHYTVSDTKLEFFHTLFPPIKIGETYEFKMVFGIHTGFSFILPQPWRDEITIENANKLAINGMFNARGWNSEYSFKGLALWENWAEIRIPIVPGILAGDLFLDMAEVHDTPKSLFESFRAADTFTENLRFSYGFGIRFTIPQLPIRLSFAKRFKIVDGQVEWQRGALFATTTDPAWMGMDFVLSLTLTSY